MFELLCGGSVRCLWLRIMLLRLFRFRGFTCVNARWYGLPVAFFCYRAPLFKKWFTFVKAHDVRKRLGFYGLPVLYGLFSSWLRSLVFNPSVARAAAKFVCWRACWRHCPAKTWEVAFGLWFYESTFVLTVLVPLWFIMLCLFGLGAAHLFIRMVPRRNNSGKR